MFIEKSIGHSLSRWEIVSVYRKAADKASFGGLKQDWEGWT